MKTKRGWFLVFEGLDKSGKTTLAKKVTEKLNSANVIYQKGLCSDTRIGKFAGRHPSSFIFVLESIYLFWKNYFKRINGANIVQDRYFISVRCHLPVAGRFYNLLLFKIGELFLPEPDLLIYCTVTKNERIKRLKEDLGNEHHRRLVDHPEYIDAREKAYRDHFEKFKGKKIRIDTTFVDADGAESKILDFLNF